MRRAAATGRFYRHQRPGPRHSVEDTLSQLFEDAPVGIVFIDVRGCVVDCNASFLKAIDVTRDEVVGTAFAERVSKEDRHELTRQFSRLIQGTATTVRLDGIRMPGGSQGDVTATVCAQRMMVSGGVTGLVVHLIDATQLRNLEAQFAQAQKMQAVGQLAGGIAHDFNNLLTAMIGFCDLLLIRHGASDPSHEDIMQIRANADRAADLIRKLLAFSRKQRLQPVIVDVRQALHDLSRMLARLIGPTISLRLDHGAEPALIRVDPGQFDQVIVNLAVNARDAMPDGGALTIATSTQAAETPVAFGTEVMAPGTYMVITVADTGTGIPSDIIDCIFEPFFSTKEGGAGTGLGLSTVYGIVRQTGGYIVVASTAGEGTTFTIYLPAASGEATALDDGPAERGFADVAAVQGLPVRTVLVAEDSEAVRLLAAKALAKSGYRVLETGDGEAALEIIAAEKPGIDLIISDVVMPGMDGLSLVRRAREVIPEVRVILMSGFAEDRILADLADDGVVRFLPKPFSLGNLITLVNEVFASAEVFSRE